MKNITRKIKRLYRKAVWLFRVYLPPHHIATVNVKNGVISFDSKDRTLGRLLYLDREFEYEMMLLTCAQLKELGCLHSGSEGYIVDVGAYVGMISIGFLKSGLFSRAIAFEPNPDNYRMTLRNIVSNKMNSAILAYNIGLSDENAELQMELSHKNFGDHRIREGLNASEGSFQEHKRRTINVNVKKFDDFMSENPEIKPEMIELFWMDIQGHEGKFLKGANNFFKKYKKSPVVMEFWPYGILRSGQSKEDFCDVIKGLFSSFFVLRDDEPELISTEKIGEYFDHYHGPDSGAHLVLLNNG